MRGWAAGREIKGLECWEKRLRADGSLVEADEVGTHAAVCKAATSLQIANLKRADLSEAVKNVQLLTINSVSITALQKQTITRKYAQKALEDNNAELWAATID